jgi:hypothetical protein
MQSSPVQASRALRTVFFAMAATMLALWGWSLQPAIVNWNNPTEDGFSMLPGFYGTLIVLPAGVFLLLGGIYGSGRHVALGWLALVVAAVVLLLIVAFLIVSSFPELLG